MDDRTLKTAPEALAFDVYGTLVDPLGIGEMLENFLPGTGSAVAGIWRQKQLEYTFRLAAMRRYKDFEQVTRKALEHALATTGDELTQQDKDTLMAGYDDLPRFDDVEAGLSRMRDAGHRLFAFSNGSPRMIEAILNNSGLSPLLTHDFVSVDEVETYKPSPDVYRHAAAKIGRPIGDVRLVSSNPFDVIGAEAAGMRAAWIDRSGGVFDALGPRPDIVVSTLTELADAIAKRHE